MITNITNYHVINVTLSKTFDLNSVCQTDHFNVIVLCITLRYPMYNKQTLITNNVKRTLYTKIFCQRQVRLKSILNVCT